MKDKQTVTKVLLEENDSNVNVISKGLKSIKKLKSIEFDDSTGFVCDINTGICGPITQEKEEKK